MSQGRLGGRGGPTRHAAQQCPAGAGAHCCGPTRDTGRNTRTETCLRDAGCGPDAGRGELQFGHLCVRERGQEARVRRAVAEDHLRARVLDGRLPRRPRNARPAAPRAPTRAAAPWTASSPAARTCKRSRFSALSPSSRWMISVAGWSRWMTWRPARTSRLRTSTRPCVSMSG